MLIFSIFYRSFLDSCFRSVVFVFALRSILYILFLLKVYISLKFLLKFLVRVKKFFETSPDSFQIFWFVKNLHTSLKFFHDFLNQVKNFPKSP